MRRSLRKNYVGLLSLLILLPAIAWGVIDFKSETVKGVFVGNLTGNVTGNVTGNADTATALAANPSDCGADTYATTIAASGALTCATVTNAGLAGSIAAAKLIGTDIATVGTITSGTWNGSVIDIARGGSNNGSLGVTAGGVLYTDGSKLMNAGAGSQGQFLQSNAASAPTWVAPPSGSGINMLNSSNPKAEDGVSSPWTETGGGTLTVTSTAANVGNGTYSFSYDASANTDHADSPAVSIPSGLYGNNCLLEFRYKGFDSNITFKVTDGSNTIASQTLSAAATAYTLMQINFACPSSGTLQMQVYAAGDAAIGYWDEVHLGSATNIGSTVVVTQWASFTPTLSWVSNTTSAGYWRRVGDQMEVELYLTTTGAPTSANLTLTIPNSQTIDTAKMNGQTTNFSLGVLSILDSGNTHFQGRVGYASSTTVQMDVTKVDATYAAVADPITQAVPMTWANGDRLHATFSVPISGWGNGTVISDQTVRTPTQQILTNGSSATYTRPAGVTHIRVRAVGAGGGGAGTGTGTSGGAGGATINTSFACTGFTTIAANAGTGGSNGAGGSTPGSGGSGSGPSGALIINGQTGGPRGDGTIETNQGGDGAASPLGNYGPGGELNGGNGTAATGYGAGGGGGSSKSGGSLPMAGGGGGSGAFVEAWLISPPSTCTYTVSNAGGTGGSAGTSGTSGGNGAPGVIIVDEFYGMNAPVMIGQNTQYDCTFSSSPAGWSGQYCFVIPYITSGGNWRMRFNFAGTKTSGNNAQWVMTGITSRSEGRQAITCNDDSGGSAPNNNFFEDSDTASRFQASFASAQTAVNCSGDVALGSKPTFVP